MDAKSLRYLPDKALTKRGQSGVILKLNYQGFFMQQPSSTLTPYRTLRLTLWVLLRSLRMRLFANLLTVIAIMLGVGLALVVPLSLRAFQQGAVDAAQIFDLLVTAEGSETQAVLNTIYYQNAPLGNIPYTVYDSLKRDKETARAVPLGFGDNVQGFPLVGTNSDYFDLRASLSAPPYYQLAQGQRFTQAFDAVLGAQVARALGLALGDTFQSSHGFSNSFEPTMHSDVFTVVGILQATGGPSDRAIYTPMASIWQSHGQFSLQDTSVDASHACSHMRSLSSLVLEQGARLEQPHQRYNLSLQENVQNFSLNTTIRIDKAGDYAFFSNQPVRFGLHDGTGQKLEPQLAVGENDIDGCLTIFSASIYTLPAGDYTLTIQSPKESSISLVFEEIFKQAEDKTSLSLQALAQGQNSFSDNRQVTAVLYATKDISALYRYSSLLDQITGVQAIFPGQVINGLLSVLGQGRESYGLLANVILALAVITIALNAYSNALQAQKSLAILRAVGVGRAVVASSVLLEAILLSLLGIVLGVLAAYVGVRVVGTLIQSQASISLPTPKLSPTDWWRSLVVLPAALLFALLPALRAAGRSPLKQL